MVFNILCAARHFKEECFDLSSSITGTNPPILCKSTRETKRDGDTEREREREMRETHIS